nr:MAG TPA: hypothetical protein [Herelleviridae sp.]
MNGMEQFNLEEYLKNPNRKIVTRDGRAVRIICTDRKFEFSNAQYPVIALIKDLNGNECVIGFTSDGKEECDYDDNTDLFFISEDRIPIKKFNLKEFQPFDRVLLRDRGNFKWLPSFFERIRQEPSGELSAVELISRSRWEMCIPYNDETKHLLGTKDDCPDYYKWWEE